MHAHAHAEAQSEADSMGLAAAMAAADQGEVRGWEVTRQATLQARAVAKLAAQAVQGTCRRATPAPACRAAAAGPRGCKAAMPLWPPPLRVCWSSPCPGRQHSHQVRDSSCALLIFSVF
jgi:hypothetical protein